MTYTQYVDAVGKAWVEVKPFVESPEGKRYSEFLLPVGRHMSKVKEATETKETWQDQNLISLCWKEAEFQ